jgi:hypothetical protein
MADDPSWVGILTGLALFALFFWGFQNDHRSHLTDPELLSSYAWMAVIYAVLAFLALVNRWRAFFWGMTASSMFTLGGWAVFLLFILFT